MRYPFGTLTVFVTVLSLLLGAWAQGVALSRPRASELVSIEICAEHGRAEILLDARGRPVAPEDCGHSLCPDCIPVQTLAAAGPAAPLAVPARFARAVFPGSALVSDGRSHAAPYARGPPQST